MSTPLLERLHTAWLSLAQGSPLPWLVLTMLVYLAAMAIYRKSGNRPMLVGCLVALFSALGIAWAFGGSQATLIAVAPKSATIPIALPMAERFGGTPSLAAVAVAITGISGTMMAPLLCRVLRLKDPAVQGFAIGLTAHAIGTARAIQLNPTAAAFSALAMGLNGVATAVLMPLVLAITPWI